MTSAYTGLKNSEELRILATVKQVAIVDRSFSEYFGNYTKSMAILLNLMMRLNRERKSTFLTNIFYGTFANTIRHLFYVCS
jgi:hypothetical protein